MELDYQAIGRRIRAYRMTCGYSQERLAELADLSVQHVSHIETANTKLSLPVLVRIANTLCVTPNDLLCDSAAFASESYLGEIAGLLDSCSIGELRVVTDIVKSSVGSLHNNHAQL